VSTPAPDDPALAAPPPAGAGGAALDLVPPVLLALAGACTLSGAVGVGWMLARGEAPHVGLLLAPPVVVLVAAPPILRRRRKPEDA